MKDKQTAKGNTKTEVKRKILNIKYTPDFVGSPTSLSNVREELTKLFRYVGNYLKCMWLIH